MTKPNWNNPLCPDCNCLTTKHGWVTQKGGKRFRRFHCSECGLTFQLVWWTKEHEKLLEEKKDGKSLS